MGKRVYWLAGISILLTAAAQGQYARISPTPLPTNEWSVILHPTAGPPLSIGTYAAGCISGASAIPLDGPGYQMMKLFRNRYYGQPSLIAFIQNLGKSLNAVGSAILISDMAQPRGGPLPYGHTSHQIGLDADIWYWTDPDQLVRTLTVNERNTLDMRSVLNSNGLVDPTLFTQETITKLKLAATSPGVERIFVNPAIKTYLCAILPTSERPWLHTLRPWPGHDDHFHVRLACPANSPACLHQAPQEEGDGCAEVIPARPKPRLETDFKMSPAIEKLLSNAALEPKMPAVCEKVRTE